MSITTWVANPTPKAATGRRRHTLPAMAPARTWLVMNIAPSFRRRPPSRLGSVPRRSPSHASRRFPTVSFKVGVQLHPQVGTVDELRTAWKAADAMGADSIWVWDHFFPLYGDPDAAHYEAYTLLAAMAV